MASRVVPVVEIDATGFGAWVLADWIWGVGFGGLDLGCSFGRCGFGGLDLGVVLVDWIMDAFDRAGLMRSSKQSKKTRLGS